MTVSELIEKLKVFPGDLDVIPDVYRELGDGWTEAPYAADLVSVDLFTGDETPDDPVIFLRIEILDEPRGRIN